MKFQGSIDEVNKVIQILRGVRDSLDSSLNQLQYVLDNTSKYLSAVPTLKQLSLLITKLFILKGKLINRKMMMHSIETKLLKNGNLTTLIRRDFMVLLMIFQSTSKMVRNKEDQSLIKMSGGLIIMEHRKAQVKHKQNLALWLVRWCLMTSEEEIVDKCILSFYKEFNQ